MAPVTIPADGIDTDRLLQLTDPDRVAEMVTRYMADDGAPPNGPLARVYEAAIQRVLLAEIRAEVVRAVQL